MGVYTNFFALAFWQQSFGFIAVVAGCCTYGFALIAMVLLDRKPTQRLLLKLRAKVRKIEIDAKAFRKDTNLFANLEFENHGEDGDVKQLKGKEKRK